MNIKKITVVNIFGMGKAYPKAYMEIECADEPPIRLCCSPPGQNEESLEILISLLKDYCQGKLDNIQKNLLKDALEDGVKISDELKSTIAFLQEIINQGIRIDIPIEVKGMLWDPICTNHKTCPLSVERWEGDSIIKIGCS